MRRILIAMMMCLPVAAVAQNTWETTGNTASQSTTKTSTAKAQKPTVDAKYLTGAVPVVDGRVMWKTTIKAPGKTAQQIYDLIGREMSAMTKEEGQFEQSRLVLADTATHKIVGNYQEWLVFKNTALVLDRTRLFYHLMADCRNGEADLTLTRVYYLYDEEREPQTLQAEDWITDTYGLTKNQKKLARVSGKFREKTIDRKDNIFSRIAQVLTK